jgi:hypothetical protein
LSAYQSQSTQFRDEECLITALCENGFTREQIEIHETPQFLIDYHGQKRGEMGTIIIRRKNVGRAANDIGFLKNADGFYDVHVSDYDQKEHGPAWVTALGISYAEHGLIKQGAIMGMVYLGTKVDEYTGEKKVQFAVQG